MKDSFGKIESVSDPDGYSGDVAQILVSLVHVLF